MEAQAEVVDVPEHLGREAPRGTLADLLEQRVAQIVGKHAGEAGGRIAGDEPGDDAERRGPPGHECLDEFDRHERGERDDQLLNQLKIAQGVRRAGALLAFSPGERA